MTSFNNKLYLLSAFLKTIGEFSLQFQHYCCSPWFHKTSGSHSPSTSTHSRRIRRCDLASQRLEGSSNRRHCTTNWASIPGTILVFTPSSFQIVLLDRKSRKKIGVEWFCDSLLCHLVSHRPVQAVGFNLSFIPP